MKTLVLGLGNPILTDDGVGIHVVRQVAAACDRPDVRFAEAAVGGLRLLELIAGYDRLILVDAIQTPDGRPGQIYRLALGDLRSSRHAGSTHDLSFPEAIAWGRRLGLALPAEDAISIIAVEAEDVLSFGETLTSAVAASLPQARQMVLDLLAA
ncbi:MAG: hydrogenase maturation protease [Anaerolineae bacterium]